MSNSIRQQIVISGVGGQGVLFITRLLAEAAIAKGLRVFTSETHGMAQRGGTVLSHLKVGEYFSPLIRPRSADGLLALKSENLVQHGPFLNDRGWAAANAGNHDNPIDENTFRAPFFYSVNADELAGEVGTPRSVNLVLLGFALARLSGDFEAEPSLFCSADDIRTVLDDRLGSKPDMLKAALLAFDTGVGAAQQ